MSSKGKLAYFDEEGRRWCTGCQQMWPRERFGGEGKYANALCKACKDAKVDATRQLRVGKSVGAALDTLVTHISSGGLVPHTQDLVESLMDACGGPQILMALFWESLQEAELGSMTAHKYFETAFRLIGQNVALGGAKKPRDLMTVDELKHEVLRLVGPGPETARQDEEEDYDGGLAGAAAG